MSFIDVISVGPGDAAQLTQAARRAIDSAQAVCCAQRHAALVSPGVPLLPVTPLHAALDALGARLAAGQDTAVLVSGDAGLYSLLGALGRRFSRDALRVYPGVSALQAFFAAMKRPWQGACVLSAHGRTLSPSALCHAARTNGEVALFLDGERDPGWVRDTLDAGGLSQVELIVGERLSYADERVAPYERRAYAPLCMALLRNPSPQAGLPPVGLADDAFIRGKTPMTKREIRTQILAALALPPDAVVWDVGAGTGSVTVECARQCPLGEVIAIEREEDALSLIRQNVRAFHLLNVRIVPGEAPEALGGLPAPTHAFIGGSGGRLSGVLDALRAVGAPVRLCASAVTMESAAQLTALMKGMRDFSAVQIAVSRLEAAGGYTMLRAQSPVFVFSATLTPEKEERT